MDPIDILYLEEHDQFEWIQGLQHLQHNSNNEASELVVVEEEYNMQQAKDAFAQQIDGVDMLPLRAIGNREHQNDSTAMDVIGIDLEDMYENCSSPIVEEKDFITSNDSPENKVNPFCSAFGNHHQVEYLPSHASSNFNLVGKRLNPLLYPDSTAMLTPDSANTASTDRSTNTMNEGLSFGSNSSNPFINPHCHCFHCLKQRELYDDSLRTTYTMEDNNSKYATCFSSDSEDELADNTFRAQKKRSAMEYHHIGHSTSSSSLASAHHPNSCITSHSSSRVTSPGEFDSVRTSGSTSTLNYATNYHSNQLLNFHSTLTAFKYPLYHSSSDQLTLANVSKLSMESGSTRKRAMSQSHDSDNVGFFSDEDCEDGIDLFSEYNNESKPRKKASQSARDVLMDWLVEHQNHPYPNKKQKQELAEQSGLTVKQIVHWMSNMRKRRLLPLLSGKRPAKSKVDVKFIQDIDQRRRKKGLPSLGVAIPNLQKQPTSQRYQGR